MRVSTFFWCLIITYILCAYLYTTNEDLRTSKILEHITLLPFYAYILVCKMVNYICYEFNNIKFDEFIRNMLNRMEVLYYQVNYFVIYYLVPTTRKCVTNLLNMAYDNLSHIKMI